MLQLGLQASLYFQLMSNLNKASPSMATFPQILETPQVFLQGVKRRVSRDFNLKLLGRLPRLKQNSRL